MQTGRISNKLSLALVWKKGNRDDKNQNLSQENGRCYKISFGKTWLQFQISTYFSGDEQVSTKTGQLLDNSRGEKAISDNYDGSPNRDTGQYEENTPGSYCPVNSYQRHEENGAKWNARPGSGISFNRGNLRLRKIQKALKLLSFRNQFGKYLQANTVTNRDFYILQSSKWIQVNCNFA